MKNRMSTFINKVKKRILCFFPNKRIISNVNDSHYNKKCLLIYITYPFGEEDRDFHQNSWQVKELAKIIGDFCYQVDVVDYDNDKIKLKNSYDLVIGLIPRGIDIYSKRLNPGAKKIAYLTSSNIRVTNESENRRIEELYQRKGVRVRPRRQSHPISPDIEDFDGALFFGNEYNLKTYAEFVMPPTFFVKNNGYSFDFDISFKKNKKSFLFFGSLGQVHKGLDLLLDIFSEKEFPCDLFVCGRIQNEKDFNKIYYKELYQTSNIHTLGFVSIHSDDFKRLVNECAFCILPSCAEGQAGSILTTMSAGVIPIASKECGYGDDEVILLDNCNINTIRNSILYYSCMSDDWVEEKSRNAYLTIINKRRKDDFSNSIRDALNAILR